MGFSIPNMFQEWTVSSVVQIIVQRFYTKIFGGFPFPNHYFKGRVEIKFLSSSTTIFPLTHNIDSTIL